MVGGKIKIYRVQITGKCICETIIESRRLHSCPPCKTLPLAYYYPQAQENYSLPPRQHFV